MVEFVAAIEDGRWFLCEFDKSKATWRNALEQVGWQIESQGGTDQQVTITII